MQIKVVEKKLPILYLRSRRLRSSICTTDKYKVKYVKNEIPIAIKFAIFVTKKM